jgi:hypothetical protein
MLDGASESMVGDKVCVGDELGNAEGKSEGAQSIVSNDSSERDPL